MTWREGPSAPLHRGGADLKVMIQHTQQRRMFRLSGTARPGSSP